MCGDEQELHDQLEHPHPTRRAVLAGAAALTGAAALSRPAASAASATVGAFAGALPVRAAMHVHASWSEGLGSWEAQFDEASRQVDLLFMTDHDFRAVAYRYVRSLAAAPLVEQRTGAARQAAVERSGESVHLRVESAGSAPATAGWAVQEKPFAWNRLRTSIAGHVLQHRFGPSRLDPGARYEVVVTLSHHPATASRPAGVFSVRYRFGDPSRSHSLEQGGRVGVVGAPLPAAGTVVALDLVADVERLWPDMVAVDNGLTMLALVATSPRRGQVADVSVAEVRIERSATDAASVISLQARVARAYAARFPRLAVSRAVEISRLAPHCNLLGVPQRFPDQQLITEQTAPAFYRELIAETRAQGGITTWNHPLGVRAGPLLDRAGQDAQRRQVFQACLRNRLYGAEVLEVGYGLRGGSPFEQHLRLWDTLSRHAFFVTGNGASDEHDGRPWLLQRNGFTTGLWSGTRDLPSVVRTLRAGRAYAVHPAFWPQGHVDVLVDGAVRMGSASVSGRSTRSVAVTAANLPPGSRLELVVGPVDRTGVDPGTAVVASYAPSALGPGGTGTVVHALPTPRSCFVRPQVRLSDGELVGSGNPVWLLREEPPGGIPPERRA